MMETVDTLVYQLEDDDVTIKLDAIRRLREVASQLQYTKQSPPPENDQNPFPVRNSRRFLNCVRRRLNDSENVVISQALLLICDLIPVIGTDNLTHLYQIVLPQLLPMLANDPDWQDETSFPDTALHALWVYAQQTNDVGSIMDLLINQGLCHDDGHIREASILAVKHLLAMNQASIQPCAVDCKMLLEVLIPAMEDENEAPIVAAEETIGWLQGSLGKQQFQKLVTQLSGRDRAILAEHSTYIEQFLHKPGSTTAASTYHYPPSSLSPSSKHGDGAAMDGASMTLNQPLQLQFGFCPKWIVDTLLLMNGMNTKMKDDKASETQPALDVLTKVVQTTDLTSVRAAWPDFFAFLAVLCHSCSCRCSRHCMNCTTVDDLNAEQAQALALFGQTLRLLDTVVDALGSLAKDASPLWVPVLLEAAATASEYESAPPSATLPSSNYSMASKLLQRLLDIEITIESSSSSSSSKRAQHYSHHPLNLLQASFSHRLCRVREEACRHWLVCLLKHPPPKYEQQQHDQNQHVASDTKAGSHHCSTTHVHQNPGLATSISCLALLLADPSLQVRQLALEVAAVYFNICHVPIKTLLLQSPHLNESTSQLIDAALEKRLCQRSVPILGASDGTLAFLNGPMLSISVGNNNNEDMDKSSLWLPKHHHHHHHHHPPSPTVTKPPCFVERAKNDDEVVHSIESSRRLRLLPSTVDTATVNISPEQMAKNLTMLKQRSSLSHVQKRTLNNTRMSHTSPDTPPTSSSLHTMILTPRVSSLTPDEKTHIVARRSHNVMEPLPPGSKATNSPVEDNRLIQPYRLKEPENDKKVRREMMMTTQDHNATSEGHRKEEKLERTMTIAHGNNVVVTPRRHHLNQNLDHSVPQVMRKRMDKEKEEEEEEEAEMGKQKTAIKKVFGTNPDKQCLGTDGDDDKAWPDGLSFHSAEQQVVEKTPPQRQMTLATRKRMEAKQRQELKQQQQNASPIQTNATSSSSSSSSSFSFSSSSSPLSRNEPKPTPTMFKLKSGDALKLALRAGKQEYVPDTHLAHIPLPGKPKDELAKCLRHLSSMEWEDQFEGLTELRQLAMHAADIVMSSLPSLVKHVAKHIDNLRSSVAKNAMMSIATLCVQPALSKRMELELDQVFALLLKRAADTNIFLSESARDTLDAVVSGCAANKVLVLSLTHVMSKNAVIRKQVAILFGKTLQGEILAGRRLETSCRDIDRVLGALCTLIADSNNEVRDAAKPTLIFLKQEAGVDMARLHRVAPVATLQRVEQVLSKMPVTTSMSGSRPPTTTTSCNTMAATVANEDDRQDRSVTPTVHAQKFKPILVREFDKIPELQKQLESSNWKDRFDALDFVKELVLSHAGALVQSGKLLVIFDGLNKRLVDGNAKVNVFALETLNEIIPAVGNGLEAVLSSLVPILTHNLAANNQKIAILADMGLDLLCDHVESKLLCAPFTAIVRSGNSRIKPGMLQKLQQLTLTSGDNNQFALHRYVLPLAFDMMKENKTEVRDANHNLLRSLYTTLGPSMLDSAYKLPKSHQDKLCEILGVSISRA